MIELGWFYKETGAPNTRTKVLMFRCTHRLVMQNAGYEAAIPIDDPIWIEVPIFCEPGTFVIV
jgi:hypothetical protein